MNQRGGWEVQTSSKRFGVKGEQARPLERELHAAGFKSYSERLTQPRESGATSTAAYEKVRKLQRAELVKLMLGVYDRNEKGTGVTQCDAF